MMQAGKQRGILHDVLEKEDFHGRKLFEKNNSSMHQKIMLLHDIKPIVILISIVR